VRNPLSCVFGKRHVTDRLGLAISAFTEGLDTLPKSPDAPA
jgi:hypothetical protein